MARYPDQAAIYDVAKTFAEECLFKDGSYFWPGEQVWTQENLDTIWREFAEKPDEGGESFVAKWTKQLANLPVGVFRLAYEVTALYCLYPSTRQFGPDAKNRLLDDVLAMGPDLGERNQTRSEDFQLAIASNGIGMTGAGYLTNRPFHIGLYLAFARVIKRSGESTIGNLDPKETLRQALEMVGATMHHQPLASMNIILHIFWPDDFEGTSSADYKQRIAKNLSAHFGISLTDDVDDTILEVRQHMETKAGFAKDFSMYESKVRGIWDEAKTVQIKTDISAAQARRAYKVSRSFHDAVLLEGGSFLWPDEKIWNPENAQQAFEILNVAWRSGQLTSIDQVASLLHNDSDISFKIGFDVQIADILRREQRQPTATGYLNRFRAIAGAPEPAAERIEQVLEVANYRTPGSQNFRSNAPLEYYLVVFGGLVNLLRHPETNGNRDAIYQTFTNAGILDNKHDWLPFWALMNRFYPDQFVGIPGDGPRRKYMKLFAYLTQGMEFHNAFAQLGHVRDRIRGDIPVELFDFFHPSVEAYAKSKLEKYGPEVEDEEQDDSEEEDSKTAGPTITDLAAATYLDPSFLEEIESLLKDKKQLIFEGPPGSGKTFVADKFARYFTGQPLDSDESSEQIELVQFHQSYSYEDFVEGIRPRTNDAGQLIYDVEPGVFREFAARAQANPDKPFVLIIDEINRGNVSRILGELMLLLEYRDKSARLPYSKTYLQIPKNLYIIGTMNSADRSLSQIDYALRRRFYFVRFMSVENNVAQVLERWLGLQGTQSPGVLPLFIRLNELLQRHVGTDDLQVGHSYFMRADIHLDAVQEQVWKYAVLPLLREYLYHHRDRDVVLAEFELLQLGDRPLAIEEIADIDHLEPDDV